jgi:hypothetical protein
MTQPLRQPRQRLLRGIPLLSVAIAERHNPLFMSVPTAGPCPRCSSENTECVESVSHVSMTWYFRCRECAHVWTLDKTVDELADIKPI